MDGDRVEYRVGFVGIGRGVERMIEPEAFPDLAAARRAMKVAAGFGVGSVLYAIAVTDGVADGATLTEVLRRRAGPDA